MKSFGLCHNFVVNNFKVRDREGKKIFTIHCSPLLSWFHPGSTCGLEDSLQRVHSAEL